MPTFDGLAMSILDKGKAFNFVEDSFETFPHLIYSHDQDQNTLFHLLAIQPHLQARLHDLLHYSTRLATCACMNAPFVPNAEKDTPLSLAIRAQHWSVVEALTVHYTEVYMPWQRRKHMCSSDSEGQGEPTVCWPLISDPDHMVALMEMWPSFLPSVLPKLDLIPCHPSVQDGVLFATKAARPHRSNLNSRKHEYNRNNECSESTQHAIWMKGAMDWKPSAFWQTILGAHGFGSTNQDEEVMIEKRIARQVTKARMGATRVLAWTLPFPNLAGFVGDDIQQTCFHKLVNSKQQHAITNPVMQAVMEWKWQRYARQKVIQEMVQYFLLALLVSAFGFVLVLDLVPLHEMSHSLLGSIYSMVSY